MVGQEKLVAKLTSYSIATFPHTIMLIGPKGCGKHLMAKELSSYYDLELDDITTSLTLETISDIYLQPLPKFYLIDSTQINEKQQNVILKFLEEPSKNSYIILLCENRHSLINTILNRCITFEFEPYSQEQLKQFIKDDNIDCLDYLLEVCKTPGQIMYTNYNTLSKLNSMCEKIIDKVSVDKASLSLPLSVVDNINFKDEYDKPDINMFINALSEELVKKSIESDNIDVYNMYTIVNKYANMLKDSRLNKKYLIESMLIDIWRMKRVN